MPLESACVWNHKHFMLLCWPFIITTRIQAIKAWVISYKVAQRSRFWHRGNERSTAIHAAPANVQSFGPVRTVARNDWLDGIIQKHRKNISKLPKKPKQKLFRAYLSYYVCRWVAFFAFPALICTGQKVPQNWPKSVARERNELEWNENNSLVEISTINKC